MRNNIKNIVSDIAKHYEKVSPQCKHFDVCGGCSIQDIPYNKQLEIKQKALEVLGFNAKIELSPKIWYYRNRMDYVCAFDKIGLRKRGTWKYVFNVEDCKLLSKESNEILKRIRDLSQRLSIPFYDFVNHEGYLRYVVIREGKFTGERMLSFVTKTRDKKILKLMEHFDEESLIWIVNETKSDVSFGDVISWRNKSYITEKLGSITYKIGPNTFFQTNPFQAQVIFKRIKDIVKGSNKVLDLFCGIGSISLFISDSVGSVDGVEIVNESVRYAKDSAKLNDITNVNFRIGDARSLKLEGNYDYVIVDPPREGLGKKLCEKLNSFKRVIYMSCNPLSQKRDLEHLKHKIVEEYAFDMFPHTPHIETLLVLEKA